jgi:hypothetical protein
MSPDQPLLSRARQLGFAHAAPRLNEVLAAL